MAAWTPRALAGDDPAAVRELCRLLTREAAFAGLDAQAVHRLQGDADHPLHPDSGDAMAALFGALERHPAAWKDVRESLQAVIDRREALNGSNGENGHH